MYIGELIKKYRSIHNLSMQEFANRASISKAYIGVLEKIYNPKTKEPVAPTLDKMKSIAKAMGMSLDELLQALNSNQPVVVSNRPLNSHAFRGIQIPILGSVIAGVPAYAEENIIGWEEVSKKMATYGKLFALKVKGDSMLPKFEEGDIVIVQEQEDVESGDVAIVMINGDEATMKQIKKTKNGIILYAFNPSVYAPHEYSNNDILTLPIRIIGRVIESRRRW